MGKPEPVLHDWTLHEQRLTVTDKRYRQAAFVKLKADALVRRDWPFAKRLKLPDHRSIWIAGTGETAMMWQQSLKENGISVEGFVDVNVASPAQLHRGLPVASYAQLFAMPMLKYMSVCNSCINAFHTFSSVSFTDNRDVPGCCFELLLLLCIQNDL